MTQFKMKLRRSNRAALPRFGDCLSALHFIAALDLQLTIMCVGRHIAIGVTDQDQIAIAFELVAGKSNFAFFAGFNLGSLWNGNVDTVASISEVMNDMPAHRPTKIA